MGCLASRVLHFWAKLPCLAKAVNLETALAVGASGEKEAWPNVGHRLKKAAHFRGSFGQEVLSEVVCRMLVGELRRKSQQYRCGHENDDDYEPLLQGKGTLMEASDVREASQQSRAKTSPRQSVRPSDELANESS
jgi:hypothetical protein